MSDPAALIRTGLVAGAVSSHVSTSLTDGWSVAETEPGAVGAASGLDGLAWGDAIVPGTVALTVGPQALDGHPAYDASDWWYRRAFASPPELGDGSARARLRFDGLATLAEVWLNGSRILKSDNMFHAHIVDVTELLQDENDLAICFRSLGAALQERRPRPRWKTRLVENQQLRWFRTTLLGRIPGWTPAIEPVGPWRPVWLEVVSIVDVEELDVQTTVEDEVPLARVDTYLRLLDESDEVRAASLCIGDDRRELVCERVRGRVRIHGEARFPEAPLWWPATHGEPALHHCRLLVETSSSEVVVDCGRVGFRHVRLDEADGRFHLVVNGTPVFGRGACWTTNDIVSLTGPDAEVERTLRLLAAAHGNMVRVGGTMVYETDAFYRICDELGIMVWQDFMFANMDYPLDDADLKRSVEAEVEQQIRRLERHPSVVAYCGSSEVEQQAAMFGAPRELWVHDFFRRTLPQLLSERRAKAPYWTSTPTGGALPFHVGEGLAHYYGVGAYERPLDDVRTAGVRFSPESLGFSNVPEPAGANPPAEAVRPHHPGWKAGVPRDSGTGWDFEDVRDHYLGEVFGVDPVAIRTRDLAHYLELSRYVTGLVMERTFDEWRSDENVCGGALVWFLKDLRPGAGWGVIDAHNHPKASYFALERAWRPQRVRLLDRGLDGLRIEVQNESADTLMATLELAVVDRGTVVTARASREVVVEGRRQLAVSADELLGHFMDLTYSYRFGPPKHEAVLARLLSADTEAELDSTCLLADPTRPLTPTTLAATVERGGSEGLLVTVSASGLARDVRIEVRDHVPEHDHFDLGPGGARTVRLTPLPGPTRPFRGSVSALNAPDAVRLSPPE